MSNFTALNIEVDEREDDEVDNTKEIQIEEAFRLYQIALNLHKQGPNSYLQAQVAYDSLLKSEIFAYAESITEFDRTEGHPDDIDQESNLLQASDLPVPSDDIPNTLPQILYLAYKNYGLLFLHMLKHELRKPVPPGSHMSIPKEQITLRASVALDCFGKALAWDESDTDLWRSAARIASFLGSKRAARYALEAAAETDDDPVLGEVLPPALGEGFAGEQLKELLEILSDEVSLEHPSLEPYKTKSMSSKMKKYMDPYPFLPQPPQSTSKLQTLLDSEAPDQKIVRVEERSWLAVGTELCRLRLKDSSATRYLIHVPPDAMPTVESPESDHVMSEAAPSQVSNSPTPIEQSIQLVEIPNADVSQPVVQNAQIINLPNRKRSHSTVAGADTPEEEVGAAKRSKRLRNRDAGGDGSKPNPGSEDLNNLTSGDAHLFLVANSILERLGVEELGTLQDLKDAMVPKSSDSTEDNQRNTALRDFRAVLALWDESNRDIVMTGDPEEIFGSGIGLNAGIKAIFEHSTAEPRSVNTKHPFPPADGLPEFLDRVENNWMILQSIVILWLQFIYKSYCEYLWSDDMKITVVKLITYADAEIYDHLSNECERLSLYGADLTELPKVQEMIQMLFELHLGIYAEITPPDTIVDMNLRLLEKDRLARWFTLAGDIQNAVDKAHLPLELELRYHWARAAFASAVESMEREHMISLWEDQRAVLTYANNAIIKLPNNTFMPEISAVAAERQISRLTSMDLFMNLFDKDQSDPSAVIMTLEPVLDPSCFQQLSRTEGSTTLNVGGSQAEASPPTATAEMLPPALRDMWKFLEGGKASLRIFLWARLGEAYSVINYKTKVFSCYLKSIEVIIADITSQAYVDSLPEARCKVLLKWIQALDLLLVKALTLALNDSTAFEIIDDAHIRSTSSALAHLSRILHCAAIFEDEIRLGFNTIPDRVARSAVLWPQGTFTQFFGRLREMQVRTWALQYTIIKDGMSQNREKFTAMDTDLAEYMAAVHYVLGLRKWCKASNKIFLKMMKLEMVRLKHVDFWEDYLGQVLFDLYGIKLGAGVYEIRDHGCPTETLDRRTAVLILPLMVTLANRMPIKDLLKSELRPTLERMQQAINQIRPTPRMTHNIRNFTEYLKSPINPLKFYEALKGKVYMDSLSVLNADSTLAEHGWFFLQGNISLAKFKSQKRVAPAAALDDVRIATAFFRIQIQFTPEHWETWYRMAQCFDSELLEDVLWTADKMNDARQDLVRQQRSAIHCYIMAVSLAMRNADASFETASKLSDLYNDFGMRIYASSREPFKMEVFYLDEFDRHFSGDGGMYKKVAYEELSRYKAWRFAATLFKRALVEKPDDWHIHYMYGKCLWKMYHKYSEEPDPAARATRPSISLLLGALKKAVATVPKPSRQEPILEPHYKILSVVHKLVLCGDLEPQAGADILQDRPYSLRKGERVEVNNSEEWEEYVLESLRQLRSADKANWHHRMIARNAHIIHDPDKQDFVSASAARVVLCQSMFTKTMVVNVWKPEFERPGRHYVYMERYVRYMIKLLFLTNDKENLDQLAKRVRKRPSDYFKFVEVWTECCTALYKLIRRHGQIPMDRDEDFKSVTRDDFLSISERLYVWARDLSSSHPALDSLREVVELKKLNGGIMKTAPLDDLINDVWAVLYFAVGVKLPGSAIPTTRPSGPMSLGNMMNLDGLNDGPVSGASIIGQDPSRPPKLGISRREILRAAETAVTRMPEQERVPSAARRRVTDDTWGDRIDPVMILPSNAPSRGSPSLGVENRVVISVPSSTHVSTPGIDRDAEMKDADVSVGGGNDVDERELSSEPGSVHDSADDESDLSDVPNMDDEDDAIIFPDLARPSEHTTSTSTPANVLPAVIPGGEDYQMALYSRPPLVQGMDKLNPAPSDKMPAWSSLSTKDFTICKEDGSRIYLNDTVWTCITENNHYRTRNIKLARILDIRTAKNRANQDIDLLIVAWYWTKQELKGHPEKRIQRLANKWPADTRDRRFEYALSNHRDVLISTAVTGKVPEEVMRTICSNVVLFCDGMEPEIENLGRLMEQPRKMGWLERAELNPEGVERAIERIE